MDDRARMRVTALLCLGIFLPLLAAGCMHTPLEETHGQSLVWEITIIVPDDPAHALTSRGVDVLVPLPMDSDGSELIWTDPFVERNSTAEVKLEPELVGWNASGAPPTNASGKGMHLRLGPGTLTVQDYRGWGERRAIPAMAVSFPTSANSSAAGEGGHWAWASAPNVTVVFTFTISHWRQCPGNVQRDSSSETTMAGSTHSVGEPVELLLKQRAVEAMLAAC